MKLLRTPILKNIYKRLFLSMRILEITIKDFLTDALFSTNFVALLFLFILVALFYSFDSLLHWFNVLQQSNFNFLTLLDLYSSAVTVTVTTSNLENNYSLKINNRKTRKRCEKTMFGFIEVVLVFLLLILNMFHTFLLIFSIFLLLTLNK